MTNKELMNILTPVSQKIINPISKNISSNENIFVPNLPRFFAGWGVYNCTTSKSKFCSYYSNSAINKYYYQVFDNKVYLASWATSVTSAMSLALSIHWNQQYLLSVQFLLDCDPFFNPSMGRPPLNSYEPLFKKVPLQTHWPQPTTPLRLPKGNRSYCDSETDCYPGWHNCQRKSVLMGSCNPGEMSDNCPIYFLYDPKIIQSHIYNVGPVTSTITIRPSFFTYSGGIYSSNENESIIGSLDVTIIGWGQQNSTDNTPSGWWYVIPHLGRDFGASCTEVFGDRYNEVNGCNSKDKISGIMLIRMGANDSGIESNAVGAIPYNMATEEYENSN